MNTEQIKNAIEYWTEFKQEAVDMINKGEDKGNQLTEQIPMCDICLAALRAQQKGYSPELQEADTDQLSEKEIEALAEKVRRGERVVI